MSWQLRVAALVACATVAFPRCVSAQAPGPLVTDRPDQTESAAVVPRGFVQLEVGWTLTRDEDGLFRLESHEVPATLIRVGLAPRLEGRLGFAGWVRAESEADPGASLPPGVPTRSVTDGWGDLDVGFKYQLQEGGTRRPEVAFITTLTLPSGDADVGVDHVDPTFRVAMAHELSERVGVGYNLGAAVTREERSTGTATLLDLLYTLAFGFSLSDRVGAFAESFGTFAIDGDQPGTHSLDGGFTLQVRENLQLDVSGGVGLNGAASDWFVGAGVAVRLPS